MISVAYLSHAKKKSDERRFKDGFQNWIVVLISKSFSKTIESSVIARVSLVHFANQVVFGMRKKNIYVQFLLNIYFLSRTD